MSGRLDPIIVHIRGAVLVGGLFLEKIGNADNEAS